MYIDSGEGGGTAQGGEAEKFNYFQITLLRANFVLLYAEILKGGYAPSNLL